MDNSEFVERVKAWDGTPFRHQGRRKGEAADCAFFLAEMGLQYTNYAERPDPKYLMTWLLHHFTRVRSPAPGDVILMRVPPAEQPQHLGVYLGGGLFIHAVAGRKVVKARYAGRWATSTLGFYRRKV